MSMTQLPIWLQNTSRYYRPQAQQIKVKHNGFLLLLLSWTKGSTDASVGSNGSKLIHINIVIFTSTKRIITPRPHVAEDEAIRFELYMAIFTGFKYAVIISDSSVAVKAIRLHQMTAPGLYGTSK
ncbi:hypothetical protein L484_020095 [Morus notabilis]|uniref:Uncharacterized protein n=1 Tax=Morus notabilis TaxID=981085 RepID=W9RBD3_9ROSA|nr:hypothetical protein L484_020095 [Morus notabilis]